MKTCTTCKVAKDPYYHFTKRAGTVDGYDTRCRDCVKATHAKSRAKMRGKTSTIHGITVGDTWEFEGRQIVIASLMPWISGYRVMYKDGRVTRSLPVAWLLKDGRLVEKAAVSDASAGAAE